MYLYPRLYCQANKQAAHAHTTVKFIGLSFALFTVVAFLLLRTLPGSRINTTMIGRKVYGAIERYGRPCQCLFTHWCALGRVIMSFHTYRHCARKKNIQFFASTSFRSFYLFVHSFIVFFYLDFFCWRRNIFRHTAAPWVGADKCLCGLCVRRGEVQYASTLDCTLSVDGYIRVRRPSCEHCTYTRVTNNERCRRVRV